MFPPAPSQTPFNSDTFITAMCGVHAAQVKDVENFYFNQNGVNPHSMETYVSYATYGKRTFDAQHNSIYKNTIDISDSACVGNKNTACGVGEWWGKVRNQSPQSYNAPIGIMLVAGSAISCSQAGDSSIFITSLDRMILFHEMMHHEFNIGHSAVMVGVTTNGVDLSPANNGNVIQVSSKYKLIPDNDPTCVMNFSNSHYYLNPAISVFCGFAEPIATLTIGKSGTYEIPSREFAAKNCVQVDFGGGLIYTISFIAQRLGGDVVSGFMQDENPTNVNVVLQNKVYVHKIDPMYVPPYGKVASILVFIIDLHINEPPYINSAGVSQTITDPSGRSFTVRVHPITLQTYPSSVFVDVTT